MLVNLLADKIMNSTEQAVYWTIMIFCLVVIFLAALFAIILVLFQKSNSDGIQGITKPSTAKTEGVRLKASLKNGAGLFWELSEFFPWLHISYRY